MKSTPHPARLSKRTQYLAAVAFLVLVITGLVALLLPRPSEKKSVELPVTETATTTTSTPEPTYRLEEIGTSVEGRTIKAYTFGTGSIPLLFVGGIHGGYEWNSITLAYKLIDALAGGTVTLPPALAVTIIPVLNPDGSFAVTGSGERFDGTKVRTNVTLGEGRFNANQVDLNRNFACRWQATSSWQGRQVSAGTTAFSEPEAATLRDFVNRTKPVGVIMWHSKASAVYASECGSGILATTTSMMKRYATAAGYTPVDTFDAYEVTGDAEGWLASIGIPAITVELSTRNSSEWDKNLAGTRSIFSLFSD